MRDEFKLEARQNESLEAGSSRGVEAILENLG